MYWLGMKMPQTFPKYQRSHQYGEQPPRAASRCFQGFCGRDVQTGESQRHYHRLSFPRWKVKSDIHSKVLKTQMFLGQEHRDEESQRHLSLQSLQPRARQTLQRSTSLILKTTPQRSKSCTSHWPARIRASTLLIGRGHQSFCSIEVPPYNFVLTLLAHTNLKTEVPLVWRSTKSSEPSTVQLHGSVSHFQCGKCQHISEYGGTIFEDSNRSCPQCQM